MSFDASQFKTLPLSYRARETEAIIGLLRAGESCSIIGISGMAKSNLFRHLLDPSARKHYLGNSWQDYLFVAADANALGEISERDAYDLLLEGIIAEFFRQRPAAEAETVARLQEIQRQVAQSGEALAWQKAFTQAVRIILSSDNLLHLVFLFDQFHELCRSLNPKFFARLRFIRDEYKYRISYITFTREEMPCLCDAPEFEEFYELFSPNVIGLAPYNRDDAVLLLGRVSGRYGREFPDTVAERLIEVTGGHPGILKAVCLAFLRGQLELLEGQMPPIRALLEIEDVKAECFKLWTSISSDEQEALRQQQTGNKSIQNREIEKRLKLKSLIIESRESYATLSPIFDEYVARQKASHHSAINVQAGPICIDAAGEVWVDGQLVTPPLSKKELSLLKYLCMNPGRLMTKDEVIAVVYPSEYKSGESVSDEALNRLVQRTREKIQEFSSEHEYVTTVRGKGYRLDVS